MPGSALWTVPGWRPGILPPPWLAGHSLGSCFFNRGGLRKRSEGFPIQGRGRPTRFVGTVLAFAHQQLGDHAVANKLAKESLQTDPLDGFARSILWLAGAEIKGLTLADSCCGPTLGQFLNLAIRLR